MIYKFDIIPIKITDGFSAEFDKLILKFIWKFKGLRIAKTISKTQQNKVGGLTFPKFQNLEQSYGNQDSVVST